MINFAGSSLHYPELKDQFQAGLKLVASYSKLV